VPMKTFVASTYRFTWYPRPLAVEGARTT